MNHKIIIYWHIIYSWSHLTLQAVVTAKSNIESMKNRPRISCQEQAVVELAVVRSVPSDNGVMYTVEHVMWTGIGQTHACTHGARSAHDAHAASPSARLAVLRTESVLYKYEFMRSIQAKVDPYSSFMVSASAAWSPVASTHLLFRCSPWTPIHSLHSRTPSMAVPVLPLPLSPH
jgi:hypothetical protein